MLALLVVLAAVLLDALLERQLAGNRNGGRLIIPRLQQRMIPKLLTLQAVRFMRLAGQAYGRMARNVAMRVY